MSTLTAIRRLGAKAGGRYAQFTAPSSGHSTSTIVGTAAGPIGSSISQNALYDGYYVYLPAASAADKVRVAASYAASTGTITVDRVYSASTVPNSKVVELHGLCWPFSDDLTVYSWTEAINEALKRLWIPVEVTITPTADATRHSLAAFTWITSGDQILDIGTLTTGEVRAAVDPYRTRANFATVDQDGATLYINHEGRSYASNETIYVKAAKRVYDHCKASAGAYGDQSGLALETDEAPVAAEAVIWGALVDIAANIRNDLTDASDDHIKARQGSWAKKWNREQRKYLQQLPPRRLRSRLQFFTSWVR